MQQPKKYTVIIKVSNDRFVKYRGVQYFWKLYKYLDENFKGWRWGNVFYRGEQVGNFTNTNRPTKFYH